MRSRQIRVKGQVQGVGYRYALRDEAQRLGITGWVRNRSDGSVEALLQGDAAALERLIAWARRGPALARVAELHEAAPEHDFDRGYTHFEIWPSA
jgi:acylphosphatase